MKIPMTNEQIEYQKGFESGRQSAQTEFEKLIDECACGKNDREWISIEELKSKLKSATTNNDGEKT